MKHIRTIVGKEWAEIFKNRLVLLTIIVVPCLFIVLPLVTLKATTGVPGSAGSMSSVPPEYLATCGQMGAGDCLQAYLITEFLILFMLLPVIIPTTIAAYSVVGEKTTHTLEPLLATPVTTEELLAGKSLAAALPAIGATWLSFFLFVLLMPLAGATPALRGYVLGPVWLTGVLLVGPLMAIAAVNFAIMVSSRVNDARVAEQISAVLILPVLGLLFAQLAGALVISERLMLLVAAAFVVVDIALVYLAARLFRRETILTRWR